MKMTYVDKTSSVLYSVACMKGAAHALVPLCTDTPVQNALSQQGLVEMEYDNTWQGFVLLRSILYYELRYKMINNIIDTRKPRSGTY